MVNFWDMCRERREVSVDSGEYYDSYEGSLNDYNLEDIYLYEIEFNNKTGRYEVNEEIWQNPVGWPDIKFNNGDKYVIDQGPVYVLTSATWAVRRKLTDEEIKGFLRRGLKKLVEKKCVELKTQYEKDVAKTEAYLDANVIKINSSRKGL